MPFDDTSRRGPASPYPDARSRRKAAADLLCGVNMFQFDIRGLETCALGWMARLGHDGWYFSRPSGKVSAGDFSGFVLSHVEFGAGLVAVAAYFDLSMADARRCFGFRTDTPAYQCHPSLVSPRMVARCLLRLPYASASNLGWRARAWRYFAGQPAQAAYGECQPN